MADTIPAAPDALPRTTLGAAQRRPCYAVPGNYKLGRFRRFPLSTPQLVEAFYERIWNAGDLGAAADLLVEDFSFRGSLGLELKGREAFAEYARSIRGALANYRCEILTCVAEAEHAFAKMHFSGIHVAPFRGYPATGKPISWFGAALFSFRGQAISELWVLGDLAGLDTVLKDNQTAQQAAAADR